MMTAAELAQELIDNDQIYFGKLDASIIIANGPIDFDDGYGWHINANTLKVERADTIFANDSENVFEKGIILKQESSGFQVITKEQVEKLIYSGKLGYGEVEALLKNHDSEKCYTDTVCFSKLQGEMV